MRLGACEMDLNFLHISLSSCFYLFVLYVFLFHIFASCVLSLLCFWHAWFVLSHLCMNALCFLQLN